MRTYLVVIDDSPEASLALRFAARRAARTGGGVIVLAIIQPQDFVAFGGVQATIEAEAREHAEELVAAAADAVIEEGVTPQTMIKSGDPAEVVREVIGESDEIAALVRDRGVGRARPAGRAFHRTGCGNAALPGDAGARRDRFGQAGCAELRPSRFIAVIASEAKQSRAVLHRSGLPRRLRLLAMTELVQAVTARGSAAAPFASKIARSRTTTACTATTAMPSHVI